MFCSLILCPAAVLNLALIVLLCEILTISPCEIMSSENRSFYAFRIWISISFSYLIVWCSCIFSVCFCFSRKDLPVYPTLSANSCHRLLSAGVMVVELCFLGVTHHYLLQMGATVAIHEALDQACYFH